MPLTVVSSSLCNCNDLSIKVLSERVWPLQYKRKKPDFFSQLSYAFDSLMTFFSQLPHGIVGPFHSCVHQLFYETTICAMSGWTTVIFQLGGFQFRTLVNVLKYTRNIFFFPD